MVSDELYVIVIVSNEYFLHRPILGPAGLITVLYYYKLLSALDLAIISFLVLNILDGKLQQRSGRAGR